MYKTNVKQTNEKCATQKAGAEKCDAKKAAEKCATQKAAAEKGDAKKAAVKCAAEKAATEKEAATVRASTEEAEKALVECALTPVSADDAASTSCLGVQPTPGETCWNCEGFLSPDHQCVGPLGHSPGPVHLFPPPVLPNATKVAAVFSPRPSSSAPVILKKPVKMLDGSPILTPKTKK